MKFSEAKDGSKTKFEKKYRKNLAEFLEACPNEKERLDVIASFAPKLTITKKELEVKFYYICANDANAELKDLEDRDKNFQDQLPKKTIEAKRKILQKFVTKLQKIDPNFKLGPEENPLATKTSLFWGLILAKDLRFITKNINSLPQNLMTFNSNFKIEMGEPNPNIWEAFCSALSPNKNPPSKQP